MCLTVEEKRSWRCNEHPFAFTLHDHSHCPLVIFIFPVWDDDGWNDSATLEQFKCWSSEEGFQIDQISRGSSKSHPDRLWFNDFVDVLVATIAVAAQFTILAQGYIAVQGTVLARGAVMTRGAVVAAILAQGAIVVQGFRTEGAVIVSQPWGSLWLLRFRQVYCLAGHCKFLSQLKRVSGDDKRRLFSAASLSFSNLRCWRYSSRSSRWGLTVAVALSPALINPSLRWPSSCPRFSLFPLAGGKLRWAMLARKNFVVRIGMRRTQRSDDKTVPDLWLEDLLNPSISCIYS
jgi:hypothetical protein